MIKYIIAAFVVFSILLPWIAILYFEYLKK
jgi:hypothetical protein